MIRAVAVLIFMSFGALVLVKFFKKNSPNATGMPVRVKILSSLRLTGRDMFFVVLCGPDVIAFVLTQAGACPLGKWNYKEWLKDSEELAVRSGELREENEN